MAGLLWIDLLYRLTIGAGLGGILGLEREIHGRPAGLRTHLLVSLGSTVFMVLSPFVAGASGCLQGDPGRIAAQIVTGIGFLGAGGILKEGVTVRGLTTAASLWIAAAIGMAAGAGCYVTATLTTTLAISTLALLPMVERLLKKRSDWVLKIITDLDVDASRIVGAVRSQESHILRCEMDLNYGEGICTTTLMLRLFQSGTTEEHAHRIVGAIKALGVSPKRVTWHAQ